ncbi:peptidase_M11 domain-containing protein, partial [Haematococcus lacustris]
AGSPPLHRIPRQSVNYLHASCGPGAVSPHAAGGTAGAVPAAGCMLRSVGAVPSATQGRSVPGSHFRLLAHKPTIAPSSPSDTAFACLLSRTTPPPFVTPPPRPPPPPCTARSVCGDGVCDGWAGESCLTCLQDCPGQLFPASQAFCCGSAVTGCGPSQCTQFTRCRTACGP